MTRLRIRIVVCSRICGRLSSVLLSIIHDDLTDMISGNMKTALPLFICCVSAHGELTVQKRNFTWSDRCEWTSAYQ